MSSSKAPTSLQQAWYRWKSLKLPWRKRFLVGLDLQGNTFWEFRDTLSSHKHRMRRIVQYPPSTQYSEVKISPQWHQWLRHTRKDPPSLTEQSQDLVRQRNLKVLAAEADARWAAKPSFLDAPDRSQPLPALDRKDDGEYTQTMESLQRNSTISAARGVKEVLQNADGLTNTTLASEASDLKGKSQAGERQATKPREVPKPEAAEDPWKQTRGGPSEGWQPKAWDGNVALPRR